MKSKAVRLHGENDLRLDEFELPAIKDSEILARVITDSICMSSYKAAIQGEKHKRVPKNISTNPVIIGHEFCGEIIEVGSKWQDQFKPGDKFTVQPALKQEHNPNESIGYSFQYVGGSATYIIIPEVAIELGNLIKYEGDAFFHGSLAEPMSCIVAAFHANYHTAKTGHSHIMGIAEGGNLAILAGAGPMGLGAIDYAINCERKPKLVVVTDMDSERLERAASIYGVEEAREKGVELSYVNIAEFENQEEYLLSLTNGRGYDDVFIFAPVKSVVEQGDKILAYDGCLNFFAGPSKSSFTAECNFYNVHYNLTHIIGTNGGSTDDMIESLEIMKEDRVNPASMVTHIGGLNSVIDTVMNLPEIPGGKKLIYTNIDLELIAIADFEEKGKTDPLFKKLSEIVKNNNGLWSPEAEKYLMKKGKPI